MKRSLLTLIALLAMISMTRADEAAPDSTPPPHHHKGHGHHHAHMKHMVSMMLNRFDTDGSGTLNQDELAAMVAAHSWHHHPMSNPYRQGLAPKSVQLRIKPTPSQIAAHMLAKFDANHDGVLDREELAHMVRHHMHAWHHHHHGEGHGHPPQTEQPGDHPDHPTEE